MSELTNDEKAMLKTLAQKLGVEESLPKVVKEEIDRELCSNCGLEVHPCLPCEEVIQFYNHVDSEYNDLLNLILREGKRKKNRTGVDTIGVFGAQAKFDIDLDAFPILTTKKIFFKAIVHELLWFIRGDTNIKYLVDNDVHIWDEWAYKRYVDWYNKERTRTTDFTKHHHGPEPEQYTQAEFIHRIKTDAKFAEKWGELGEGTYGGMWRAFPYYVPRNADNPLDSTQYGTVDQLKKVVDKLKTNPDDRRIIVSAWHPYWVDHCALPPCHCMFHFHTEVLSIAERIEVYHNGKYGLLPKYLGKTEEDQHKNLDNVGVPRRRLNCLLYQRSCDTFLGVPFNITSYCLLTALIAHCVNMVPGVFTHTYGDLHIYENHLEQVKEQLSRTPKILPKLVINPNVRNLMDFKFEDIQLVDYKSHPAIKAPIAV